MTPVPGSLMTPGGLVGGLYITIGVWSEADQGQGLTH